MELMVKGADALTVSETTFGREFNEALVHQVVVAYAAGARQGTRAQKTRSEVSGGGAKHGVKKVLVALALVQFVAQSGVQVVLLLLRNHKITAKKVNKKMYRGAMKSILSELVRQERLIVVDNFSVEAPKTKELVAKLKELELTDALIVTSEVDENLFLAARNLYKVDARDVAGIDPVSLIAFDKVVMTAEAVKQVEEMLA